MKDNLNSLKREQADRMVTGLGAVMVMERLAVVTIMLAQGKYQEAYKACGEVEKVLYRLQENCQAMEEKYHE
jgi:hypothetical protein